MAVFSWLENRSRGIHKYGQTDTVFHSIYSRIQNQKITLSDDGPGSGPGGIYNLEFSPNG